MTKFIFRNRIENLISVIMFVNFLLLIQLFYLPSKAY